ncbi:MAG: outer membrane lipoprotein chaperone LolA [Bryobacterales bacterium]|nr:outer membrane lipoprotein chaperone LolA [Bryobacteraceae bacterium]MDW8130276.1 outer membrane lipoprotein chaperone LolA [Bryobacterales bacterium]
MCLAALAATAPAGELGALLRALEERYNRARTLEAAFEQSYRGQGRAWKPERGKLWLRKPGKMRWEYSEPAGKLFVTDGRFAWLYSPALREVERTRLKETDDLRAPLAFLLGKLDFQRDFGRFVWRREGPDYWIVAEPRSERLLFSRVEFRVDAELRIRHLRVEGQDRSVMEFRFDNERLNPPLEDSLFEFRPPPGVRVIESNL